MGNRGRQHAEAGDSCYVGKFRPGLVECLLREPARSHVLNRTDVLPVTIIGLSTVANKVQVLHPVIGKQKTMFVLEVTTRLSPFDYVMQDVPVFWVDS